MALLLLLGLPDLGERRHINFVKHCTRAHFDHPERDGRHVRWKNCVLGFRSRLKMQIIKKSTPDRAGIYQVDPHTRFCTFGPERLRKTAETKLTGTVNTAFFAALPS